MKPHVANGVVALGKGCCAVWIGVSALSAQAQQTTTVTLSGQQAAGLEAGYTYGTVSRAPSIAADGRVALVAWVFGPDAPPNHRVVYAGAPGALSVYAQTFQPAAGVPSGLYSDFKFPPVVTPSGQIAFNAQTSEGNGIFAGAPGAVTAVAFVGNRPPGAETGKTYTDFPSFTTHSATGKLAFTASMDAFLFPDDGIWTGAPGSLALAARSNQASPGGGGGYYAFGTPGINAAGHIAFSANLLNFSTFEFTEGIWTGAPGALTLKARQGQQAPGTPAGVTFKGSTTDPFSGQVIEVGFMGGSINGNGDIAFYSPLTGSGVDASNDAGLWVSRDSGSKLIARKGMAAPGAGPDATFAGFASTEPKLLPRDPALNNEGRVAFLATVQGPGVSTGEDDEGIWLGNENGLRMLVRTGRRAPGTEPGVKFAHLGYPSINGGGETAFVAQLAGDNLPGPTLNKGIFATDLAGHTLPLVRAGGSLEVAPGDRREVADIYVVLGNNNQDGVADGLNDRGEVAYAATFADGGGGVFVTRIPYPCDANGDDVVNASDFRAFCLNYGKSGTGLPGDFNYDDSVNFHDFQLLERYYGSGRQVPAGASDLDPAALAEFARSHAVPESSTSLALSLALTTLARRTRRRGA
jgi:hypothetical protein